MKLPYHPAFLLLGIYPEKTTILKDTCTPVFIAALFMIARIWKQPRCPSTDEQIKKTDRHTHTCTHTDTHTYNIYTMGYYSAIKRNKSESVLVRWMNLEPVIQSEESQKEENKYCILTHMYGI